MPITSRPNAVRYVSCWQKFTDVMQMAFRPLLEIWNGFRSSTLPIAGCLFAGIIAVASIQFNIDRWLWQRAGLRAFYPAQNPFRIIYLCGAGIVGFVVWGIYQAGLYHQFLAKLDRALENAGLRNRLGYVPKLLGHWPIDSSTRKLRLTNASLPIGDFVKARPGLEAALRIYVDDIREKRECGTMDIIYSSTPMPTHLDWQEDWIKAGQMTIGQTRSKRIESCFSDVPHLLVAGQTGGGKSTFLRQVITSQYLADESIEFCLIDLKGGLEFQMFQDLSRIRVLPDLGSAISALIKFESLLAARMTILKSVKFKDRDSYIAYCKKSKELLPPIIKDRLVIVIDEASEMFLAGHHASSKDIQSARRIISQIARQGRAVGVHLIIATQRPDSRALDPQVKANLTGVLCFQMANDASSMVVLGCGRATDLPAIPGRAIWKSGANMVEVQVPYMSPDTAEDLLGKYRIQSESEKIQNIPRKHPVMI